MKFSTLSSSKLSTHDLLLFNKNKLEVSYKTPDNFDVFLNNLPDVVIITDSNFTIKGFNHAAESFFGRPASFFIGTVLEESMPFSFCDTRKELAMRELFSTGLWNGNIRVQRNGQELIFNATVSLVYNERTEVKSIVFVNHNITEEQKQEKNLKSANNKYKTVVDSLSEGVILISTDGKVLATNRKAAEILRVKEADLLGIDISNSNWNAVRPDGTAFYPKDFPANISFTTGAEVNNVVMGLNAGTDSNIWISVNSRPIFKEGTDLVEGVVTSMKDITSEKFAQESLKQSEALFKSFMANSPTLGWIYDDKGNFIYGNPLFNKLVGLDESFVGKNIIDIGSPNIAKMVLARNRQVIENGQSMITEDELELANGDKRHFVANWFLIPGGAKNLIGGQATDITDKIKAQDEINKMHERFGYVVNASSDAIWDLDLRGNTIYRSDAFADISGYKKEEISPTVNWWFDKIHPDDQHRVQQKVMSDLAEKLTGWEDEYRFQHADGTYRFIYDKGFTIYEDGVPVRQIGSMKDITERKKLELELLNQELQKQKLVNQATINAQEEERNRISAELHDNVNQLLASSRLHIGVAKNNPDNQEQLLNKATEYLMMAVEEIRSLSKRMNSHIVASVGLEQSITDIAYNMQKLNKIELDTDFDSSLISRLSPAQQLMVFRIVQEQSSNIIKYANATKVELILTEKDQNIHLLIKDNGVGFDVEKQKNNGIGFINIFNRVDTYNGKVNISSSPGQGCEVEIYFPLIN